MERWTRRDVVRHHDDDDDDRITIAFTLALTTFRISTDITMFHPFPSDLPLILRHPPPTLPSPDHQRTDRINNNDHLQLRQIH